MGCQHAIPSIGLDVYCFERGKLRRRDNDLLLNCFLVSDEEQLNHVKDESEGQCLEFALRTLVLPK